MEPFRQLSFFALFFSFCVCVAGQAAAQDLVRDLTTLVETPAVTGYEQPLAAELRARLSRGLGTPKSDNLGSLLITIGQGTPHRLIVAPMDEPGYLVSGITPDGYLRVQRLPQRAAPPEFDRLYSAQPVVIGTRKGKWVSGVVGGLSVHLQPDRLNAPRGAHPDEMYIDIGASSAAEVAAAGVDLLDPVALDRRLYHMGFGRLADRLVALARANGIAVQYGITGGGNDRAAFLRYGSTDVPLAWPLRYSHSPGEVIDTRDLQALTRIVAVLARGW